MRTYLITCNDSGEYVTASSRRAAIRKVFGVDKRDGFTIRCMGGK